MRELTAQAGLPQATCVHRVIRWPLQELCRSWSWYPSLMQSFVEGMPAGKPGRTPARRYRCGVWALIHRLHYAKCEQCVFAANKHGY